MLCVFVCILTMFVEYFRIRLVISLVFFEEIANKLWIVCVDFGVMII